MKKIDEQSDENGHTIFEANGKKYVPVEEYEKLKKELEHKDGTRMFEILMKNTDGEAAELLSRHCYDMLKCALVNAEREF